MAALVPCYQTETQVSLGQQRPVEEGEEEEVGLQREEKTLEKPVQVGVVLA